ncbi:MAG: BON domain-containing protein [Terriglobales bacterium]
MVDESNRRKQEGAGMKHVLKATFSMLALAAVMTLASTLAGAQDATSAPAPDNTKVNERDRSTAEATADQQKENRSDRDITRDIRRSITQDKSLSSYAHNVKIISQNGMVTLKGPVRSEDEKMAIEARAAAVVGKDKVTSQLEVKPKQ